MLDFIKRQGARFVKRSEKKARLNLGVITLQGGDGPKRYRDCDLEVYDAYYENRQFDGLADWDHECDNGGDYIPVRQRKPRIMVPMAKTLVSRLTSKIFGEEVFPKIVMEEMPDEQEFVRAVIRESHLQSKILEPTRRMLNTGSIYFRYWLVDGVIKTEHYDAKYCYPTFAPNGELESIDIKYVFVDTDDLDDQGNAKKKWYKVTFNTSSEILFDNPLYDPNAKEPPVFKVVEQVDHDLGFVQGEWFRTCEQKDSPDGYPIVKDVMDFIDELCYSISQSSQAVGYNQDPQLVLNEMDEEEIGALIRSATKVWNLGKNGKAEFIEGNLNGVERAEQLRDKVRLAIQDVTRIILMDPEKISTLAQSGEALKVLNQPFVDLVTEIRAEIGPQFKKLVNKMCMTVLICSKRGIELPIEMPEGWMPQSLDFVLKWRSVFQQTLEDLSKKVQLTVSAMTGRAISEEAGTRFLAEDFNIDDVEAEIEKIKAQPIANPFGGF